MVREAQPGGWRVAHAGGNVNNGRQAGFATLNANNSSANRNSNIGSHVCFIIRVSDLAARQNTKRTPVMCWYGNGRLRGLKAKSI